MAVPILLLQVVSVSIVQQVPQVAAEVQQVPQVAADIAPRILFRINGVHREKLLHLVRHVRTLRIINGGGAPQADGDAGGGDGNAQQGGDNRVLLLDIESVSEYLQPLQPLQPPENNFLYLLAENQIVYNQLRGLDGAAKTIHLFVRQGNEEIRGATLWSKSQDIIFKIGLPIALGIGLFQMSTAIKSQAQITGRAPAIGDGNNAAAGDSDDFTPLIEKLKKQIKKDDFQKKNFEDARKHAVQKVTAAVLNVMGACLCALYNGLIGKHLVRLRWDELNPDERRNFASVAVDLMSEITNSSEE
ncbi:hypothetical protein T459_07122 [Capsicum annuum]|uniref:Uncharacterized protein n=1 Tax=Capsicum annuum TaxID=4072 RepID=A0A2G3ACN0_CAPAN|nr:hypothetical protein T459_07122 [Capsicum annuum]